MPFFRFQYFDSTPATLDLLQSRGILVFGADLWAADWENMTPEQELKKVIEQLEITRKGIILLHDPKARTAAMMPAFLRYLHDQGCRIVHLVPAAAPVQTHADGTLDSAPKRAGATERHHPSQRSRWRRLIARWQPTCAFGCARADAGDDLSAAFRQGLTARGLAWAVGIPRHLNVYPRSASS